MLRDPRGHREYGRMLQPWTTYFRNNPVSACLQDTPSPVQQHTVASSRWHFHQDGGDSAVGVHCSQHHLPGQMPTRIYPAFREPTEPEMSRSTRAFHLGTYLKWLSVDGSQCLTRVSKLFGASDSLYISIFLYI